MGHKARTKDENFMIRLYEEALKSPDINDSFDRYYIGSLAGIQPKAVDAICTLLGQANFIKKKDRTEISITPQGINLVKNILESD